MGLNYTFPCLFRNVYDKYKSSTELRMCLKCTLSVYFFVTCTSNVLVYNQCIKYGDSMAAKPLDMDGVCNLYVSWPGEGGTRFIK